LVSGEKSEIPCLSADRFASLRMTIIYKSLAESRVGLQLRRKPTLLSSHNSLIVIGNEVRNLNLICITKILPENSDLFFRNRKFHPNIICFLIAG